MLVPAHTVHTWMQASPGTLTLSYSPDSNALLAQSPHREDPALRRHLGKVPRASTVPKLSVAASARVLAARELLYSMCKLEGNSSHLNPATHSLLPPLLLFHCTSLRQPHQGCSQSPSETQVTVYKGSIAGGGLLKRLFASPKRC